MTRRKAWHGWPGEEHGYDLDIAGRVSNPYFRVSDNPEEEQKSVGDQSAAWLGWTDRRGVQRGETYTDDDESASEFRHGEERPDFARLRADIAAGKLDGRLLWFWSSSRLTRGDVPLDTLAAECIAHGIVWVFGGKVLNPANYDDLGEAERMHLADKAQPRQMRTDVRRGKESSARKGMPAAVPLYGYRRVYKTGEAGQPVLSKGRPVIETDEPAEPAASVVREIFARIEAGETLSAIRASLEDRRIPSPRFPRKCTTCGYRFPKKIRECPHGHAQDLCQWHVSAVRFIAMNPGYIGQRLHRVPDGLTLAQRRRHVLRDTDGQPVMAIWQPLVDEDRFWRVQAILDDAHRARWSGNGRGNPLPGPGETRSRHHFLLVPGARCASCGAALGGHWEQGRYWYKCRTRGCTTIRGDWLDAWAEDRLVSWLVLPEARQIWDSGEGDVAEAELAALYEELEDAKRLVTLPRGQEGRISLGAFAVIEASLEAQIEALEAKRGPVALRAVLDIAGQDAADRWMALKRADLRAACRLMAEVAIIYVHPAAGRGGGVTRGFDESRCEWRWKIGPAADPGPTRAGCTEALAARKAALEAARGKAAELLRADPSQADAAIGRLAGCAYGTVGRIRRELTEAGEITDPGYRTGRNGKTYRSTGNGRPGSPRKNIAEGPVTRRSPDAEAKRARIAAALAEHPGWSHHRIGTALGVAHDTVASVCAETGTECGHGRGGQGSRTDLATPAP